MLTIDSIRPHITGAMRNIRKYRKYGDELDSPKGKLFFQDNGADILAVCHLDTVMWNKKPVMSSRTIKDCPQLDDRLGAAAIIEWLSEVAIFDLLLCDMEECAQSTAQYFVAPREYRYAIEFDRAGSDCVLYQYDDAELSQSLEYCGVEVGRGSFSDIAFLDIGCQCVNWGVGYHSQHTKGCYANLCEVNSQLAKFANWYSWFGDRSFLYVEKPQAQLPWRRTQVLEDTCMYCGGQNESGGLDLLCEGCRKTFK